jgi:hypothetical protein
MTSVIAIALLLVFAVCLVPCRKNQTVGHEMIVFDELALLVSVVFLNSSVTAEPDPLNEIVELFALVGRSVNR